MSNIIHITDLDLPELDVYARLSEVQLLRYNEPDLGLFICESPKVIMRALDAGYEPVSLLVEEKEIKDEETEYPDEENLFDCYVVRTFCFRR